MAIWFKLKFCNIRGNVGSKCSTRRQRCRITIFTERVRYTVRQSKYKQTNPIRDGQRGSSFIQSRVVTQVVVCRGRGTGKEEAITESSKQSRVVIQVGGCGGKGTGKEKANTESIIQARVVITRTLEIMGNAGTLETRGKQRRTGNETQENTD